MEGQTRKARIVVMGVGGGGCNAVSSMVAAGVDTAEFVAINTDGQALELVKTEHKIAIGHKITNGLGAGARPDVGKAAAEESREEIRNYLNDIDMLFITAGMGGGTGTGAAPIIAQMAREKNILTVGVVTRPFGFEGAERAKNAEMGIQNLRQYVDTLIVIPNDNLLKVLGGNVSFVAAFKHADSVLRDAIRGLTDLIATPAMLNLDFADVKTIMKDKGIAHLAIGTAEGDHKIERAVKEAIMSELLETNITGATHIILSITGGTSLSLKEVTEASNLVKGVVSKDANIIFGTGFDESYGDKVQVLLVATGFEQNKRSTKWNASEGMQLSNEQLRDKLRIGGGEEQAQQNAQQVGGYRVNPVPYGNMPYGGRYQVPNAGTFNNTQPMQPQQTPIQPVVNPNQGVSHTAQPNNQAPKSGSTPPWYSKILGRRS